MNNKYLKILSIFLLVVSLSCSKDSLFSIDNVVNVNSTVGVQFYGGGENSYAVQIQAVPFILDPDTSLLMLGHRDVRYSFNLNKHSDITMLLTNKQGYGAQSFIFGMDTERGIITRNDTVAQNLIYEIELSLEETNDRAIAMTSYDDEGNVLVLGETEMEVEYKYGTSNLIRKRVKKPVIYQVSAVAGFQMAASTMIMLDTSIAIWTTVDGQRATASFADKANESIYVADIEPMSIVPYNDGAVVLAKARGDNYKLHLLYFLDDKLEVSKVIMLEASKGLHEDSYSDMILYDDKFVISYTNEEEETIMLRVDSDGNQEEIKFPTIQGLVQRVSQGWEDQMVILTNFNNLSSKVYEVKITAPIGSGTTNWGTSIITDAQVKKRDWVSTSDNFDEYMVATEQGLGELRVSKIVVLSRNEGIIKKQNIIGEYLDKNDSGALIQFNGAFAYFGTNDFGQYTNMVLALLNDDLQLVE